MSMAYTDLASTQQEGREHAEVRIVVSAAFVSESGVASMMK